MASTDVARGNQTHQTRRSPRMAALLPALVQAAEDGDRARFDAIFEVCVSRVYGIAWNVLRDRKRAEEVTARVLIDAVDKER